MQVPGAAWGTSWRTSRHAERDTIREAAGRAGQMQCAPEGMSVNARVICWKSAPRCQSGPAAGTGTGNR